MGRSLALGLLRSNWPAGALCGADPDPQQRERLRREAGIEVHAQGAAAAAGADVVVLAVKPASMADTLRGLAAALREHQPLLISVAAGVRMESLEDWAGARLPIVRAMPNTPALIGAGAAGLYCGPGVSPERKLLAQRILGAVGTVQWVDREELLDAVTALSGSGPAYFFLMMEGLIDAAVRQGLTPEQARELTVQTALGAARMAAGPDSPAVLRQQVTSPGGTTEQALRVLEECGLRQALADALEAARCRAAELGRRPKRD